MKIKWINQSVKHFVNQWIFHLLSIYQKRTQFINVIEKASISHWRESPRLTKRAEINFSRKQCHCILHDTINNGMIKILSFSSKLLLHRKYNIKYPLPIGFLQ